MFSTVDNTGGETTVVPGWQQMLSHSKVKQAAILYYYINSICIQILKPEYLH